MERRQTLWGLLTCADDGLTEQDRRNQWVATAWVLAWGLAFAGASLLLGRELVVGPGRWAIAIVPTLIGLGAFLVYRRFLVQADELQQKIQLHGLAFGFGVGVIGSVGLELLEDASGMAFNTSTPMVLMVAAYAIAIFRGLRRYS